MAPIPSQKIVVPLLALIAAGLAGNAFSYPIFFGVEFLFGGIFAMLALQLLGYGPGIIAAIAISSITWVSSNHPYFFIVMTIEVIAVGWLHRRKGLGLVVTDTAYWFCIGMPFVYLCHRGLLHAQPSTALITMFKLAINGIANALQARLIFMAMNFRSRANLFPLREVTFNLLALFVFIPSVALMAHQSREEFKEMDHTLGKSVVQASQSMADSIETWLGQKSSRIAHLAWMNLYGFPEMQQGLDFLHSMDPDLNAVGIIDKHALSTAFSPQIDEFGQSTIGKDFSDRPYLAELKRSLLPQISDVVISKIGRPEPVVVLMAPIVADGIYEGYVASIINLKRVQRILSLQGTEHGLSCTILDRNNTVVATNRNDLKVMAPFSRGAGELRSLANGLSQWQPALPAQSSFAERWQGSWYVAEQKIGGLAEWQLIVEQPVAPFLQEFYVTYAEQLELVFLLLLVALVCAEIFSRKVLASVVSLQGISSTLPEKLDVMHKISWPTSFIREVDELIQNFRDVADLLVQKFSEIKQLNLGLEQRIDERTRALQESEAKYRIIFENKMYAIYIFDLESLRILEVNEAFASLYGFSHEDVLAGMTIHDLTPWADEMDFVVHEAMLQGSIFMPLRYHLKKDGTIFPVEIAVGPYLWQGRQVMFAIANDITKRKKATDALKERTVQLEDLTKNLENKIEEEVERRRKNEQILLQQSKLAAMGEMLGAIAHQWRQPLNSLGLCIQNIKDSYRYGELSQEYLDITVQKSMAQISHMSKTIDDFRNFFQPDKEKVLFDAMRAVGEVLKLFAAQLAAHNISFLLTCKTHQRIFAAIDDIVTCPAKITVGYKNEFEHVILNLLSNARDAICQRREEGVMAEDEKGVISFEFATTEHTIIITVNDNGGGIQGQVIDRIFEPYFTTKDPDKGSGIGLYLSRIIIEDHMHGKLWVKNDKGGASFVMALPVVEDKDLGLSVED